MSDQQQHPIIGLEPRYSKRFPALTRSSTLAWRAFQTWSARRDVRLALAATLGLRLFCSIIAAAGYVILTHEKLATSLLGHSFITSWLHWDTAIYLHIATSGYSFYGSTAFMPFYPLFMRLVGTALGGHYLLAALLISTVSTFGALLCLYRLVERFSQVEGAAGWAMLVSVLLPISFFLMAGYTEAIFLWLTFGALLAFLHNQWGRLAILAVLATLTRQQGLLLSFLVLPLFARALKAWWQKGLRLSEWRAIAQAHWKPLLAALAGPAAYLAWLLCIGLGLHAALPWQTLESTQGWGLHFTWPGAGWVADVVATARGTIPIPLGISVPLDATAALLVGITLVFALRRFPPGILLYFIANWCLALMKVQADGLTVGTARYLLPLLPLALLPGELLASGPRFLRPAWIAVSSIFLFACTWGFTTGGWIN